MIRRTVVLTLALTLAPMLTVANAHNRIDMVRPDAPELAAFGAFTPGVRTLEFVNPDQLDIVNARPGAPTPVYDRPLVVEVWYPADAPTAAPGAHAYTVLTRDGATTATLYGRAQREAAPLSSEGPFPLVILSHGYPGNRFLMSHFGENLASKGFVVASIDHTDSTYADQAAFGSTLLNRPLDQLFVLDAMARLGADDTSDMAGLIDADRSAIVGYSMGGFGALNAVGAGFTAASVDFGFAPPNQALRARQAGTPEYLASLDERVRAVIAIGPWGMPAGFWDAEGLAGISTPVLFMAGSVDDVSGYERGVAAIFERTVNAERYLLTFVNANHNAAAPIAPPREVGPDTFGHYADAVWDNTRMNNVAQHFATAFLGIHLQGDETLAPYLDLVTDDATGNPTARHTSWRGFPDRTAVGLRFEQRRPE
jgi:predicted dienelactone hydrolase